MGHSQEEKARSRERILDAAACRIRREGLNGFSIAEVMKDAGLTHGSFYAHFSSRDQLVAAALQHALLESDVAYSDNPPDIASILKSYLSRKHRDEPWAGCAVSALASEVTRAGDETREVMDQHLLKYLENMTGILEDTDNDEHVVPVISMMIGALTLSRLTKDPERSDRMLKETRDYLLNTLQQK